MTSRLTHRRLVLLAIAAAAGAAAACSDTSLTSPEGPSTTLRGQNAASNDSGHSTPTPTPTPSPDSVRHDSAQTSPGQGTHPDTVHATPDSVRAGAGTLWAIAVENFVIQWKDAAGVSHDSVGFRGIGGVTVKVYSTATRPDSTSGTSPQETLVATLQSDATGQVHSAKLPDGFYTLRASGTVSGTVRTSSANAQLLRGNQLPTVVYLNLW
jgi:hypothetical protein